MAEGRRKDAWSHTSALLALIANAHRDPKKSKPFEPDDFSPFANRRRCEPKLVTKDLTVLKAVFVDRRI